MRTTKFYLLLAIVILMTLSCTLDSAPPSSNNNDDNTKSVAILGKLLATQTPLTGAGKITVSDTVSEYKIIAQALATKRIYVITTESDGAFEFIVPVNDSYTFHILDEAYHYIAPIVLSEFDPRANWVPEGMEVSTADVDLGDVILSEDEYIAVLSDDSVIIVDEDMIGAAIAGIPAGASTQGSRVGNYDGYALDLDKDGIINIMDSDDDGDGILDEFDDDWATEVECAVVQNVGLFSNFHSQLDAQGEPPTSLVDDQYIITVECVVLSGQENKITGVSISGPEYLGLFNIDQDGLVTNWGMANNVTLVKDYLSTVLDERWGAFVRGAEATHIWDVVTPGDVWIFEITYTDNGTEYTALMAKKINFIFEETPENIYINGQAWTSETVYSLPDTVVFKWNTINSLPGMGYTVGYIPVVNNAQYHDGSGGFNAGIDGDSAVFIFTDTTAAGDTIQTYHIDIVASDQYGDNAKTQGGHISKWVSE